MNAEFILLGVDPSNPKTHVLIEVLGRVFSVFAGCEQDAANEITASLQG